MRVKNLVPRAGIAAPATGNQKRFRIQTHPRTA
jgi:hypothetical protein